ncbi:hypothetical protein RRG08_006770 [Elysia crispata]|uniref:Uncharacterized protein n=1 Tax=Elysia crispata TaxID=231223 RepID=A0AAE0YBQ7_9GAST|nr:hypothetical protein RRG08_006770 [Elysia crispata]
MPLNRRWRSMDIFGSHESLNKSLPPSSSIEDNRLKPGEKADHHHNHSHHHHHHQKEHHHFFSLRNPFRPRLASGPKEDTGSSGGGGGGMSGSGGGPTTKDGDPPTPAAASCSGSSSSRETRRATASPSAGITRSMWRLSNLMGQHQEPEYNRETGYSR